MYPYRFHWTQTLYLCRWCLFLYLPTNQPYTSLLMLMDELHVFGQLSNLFITNLNDYQYMSMRTCLPLYINHTHFCGKLSPITRDPNITGFPTLNWSQLWYTFGQRDWWLAILARLSPDVVGLSKCAQKEYPRTYNLFTICSLHHPVRNHESD